MSISQYKIYRLVNKFKFIYSVYNCLCQENISRFSKSVLFGKWLTIRQLFKCYKDAFDQKMKQTLHLHYQAYLDRHALKHGVDCDKYAVKIGSYLKLERR